MMSQYTCYANKGRRARRRLNIRRDAEAAFAVEFYSNCLCAYEARASSLPGVPPGREESLSTVA